MKQYSHIIHRQIAEIGFADKSGVQELYREISNLFNHRLTDITNRVFDQAVSLDNFIGIERLEIDLGTLPYPFSEQEFAERYEAALEKIVSDELKNNITGTGESDNSNHKIYNFSYAKLLHRFLMEGILIWWTGEDAKIDPETAFFTLLEENTLEMKNVLLSTGPYAQARKRLVEQFSEQVVIEVIKLLEPGEADFIVAYQKDIVQLQQKEQFIKAETDSFKKALWYFILTYLFADMTGHFQRKMFVKSTLTQMAAHFNISYGRLLLIFSETVAAYPDFVKLNNSLSTIIIELEEETNYIEPSNEVITQGIFLDNVKEYTDLEILKYYLFYGSLPFHYHYFLPVQIESLLQKTLKQNPEWFKHIFEKETISESIIKRLTHILPNSLLTEFIHLIEPAQSAFIINYHATTVGLQKKKNIVKAEESEFSKSLWEFIFSFLLNDKGTLFNEKAFVESNIRRLARHYNMSFKDLLLFLTQGMGEKFSVISKYSSLFYIFTEILQQHIKDEHPEYIFAEKIIEEQNSSYDKIYISNVFLFWLTEGHLPWWSAKTFPDVQELFAAFISENPKEAVQIIQSALQKGIPSTVRLDSLFAELENLIKHFSDGHDAIVNIKELELLVFAEKRFIASKELKNSLLISALEAYYQKQFQHFDRPAFLLIFLKRLHASLGLEKTVLFEYMIDFLKSKSSTFTKDDLRAFEQILKEKKEPSSYNKILKDLFPGEDERALWFEEKIFTGLSSGELLSRAIELVRHFLMYGSFPKYISITTVQENFLLSRLLLLIYKEDKAQLQNIFGESGFLNSARMRLHDVFSQPGNQEMRNISGMLQAYIERDTVQYMQENWPQINKPEKAEEFFLWLNKQGNENVQKSALSKLSGNLSIVSLIVSKYKGAEFIKLITLLSNDTQRSLVNDYIYLLSLAANDSFERELLLQHFREFCLIWFSSSASFSFFFTDFLIFLTQRKNRNVSALYMQLNRLPDKLALFKVEHLQRMVLDMQNKTAPFAAATAFQAKINKDREENEKKILQSVFRSEEETVAQKEPSMKEKITQEGESIYLQNAGLVLLHPFFSTFFERIALTGKDKKFVSEEAKLRSPLLLQYLVTAQPEEQEHNLVLNKILCGLTHADVIPLTIELTEIEKQTAEGLLHAVIQQWDKLKNTSVQGFRESFLQRTGTLTETDEAWTLKVDTRGYDILLQTLPWGLSMIKTPWMNKPLFVTWI